MKKFQSLGRSLSKEEMKKVLGGVYADPGEGGTCGYWYLTADNDYITHCNVSKDEATTSMSKGVEGHWCCDSCYKTSYCGSV